MNFGSVIDNTACFLSFMIQWVKVTCHTKHLFMFPHSFLWRCSLLHQVMCGIMLSLLLCLLLLVQYATSNSCSSCENLSLIPASLAYNGTDLPIVALYCNVTGDCHVDFGFVVQPWISKIPTSSKYVVLDIYFDCPETTRKFGKSVVTYVISWC